MSDDKTLVPPHSLEAEQSVLGGLLFDNTALAEIADTLQPEDFYRTAHQHIYRAAVQLFQMGEPVDIVFLSERLNDAGMLEAAGGRAYLMDLAMSVATAANIAYYARLIRNKSMLRRLIMMGHNMAEACYGAMDAEAALEAAQAEILKIAQAADCKNDPGPAELAREALANIQQRIHYPNRLTGLTSGFSQLDRYLSGLQAGKLIILGARPAMGKSGFALNIATHVAVAEQRPVLFYSLEMEPVKLVERALISMAESQSALEKLQGAAEAFPGNLRIIDRPTLTLTALRASMLRSRIEMGPIGLVVIDYLQLMKSSGGNRNEEVSAISRGLKLLAREFKVPVLALAQLSREVEKRQDKRPMNSDLRDSGAVEQDADTIIFLYRDEYYNPGTDKPNMAEVIVAKNRDGQEGRFELFFRKNIVKFVDVQEKRYAVY